MTLLTPDTHLAALAASGASLADAAARAGWEAKVPTCPGWTVAHLVAHVGMIHRWAAGALRGDDSPTPSLTTILAEVPREELGAWFAEGLDALLATFAATPADVSTFVFLKDAPPARAFWARRQAHETTIHAADALAAALGRVPTAAEAGVSKDLAVDGVDELLRGFYTRGRSKLATGEPLAIAVVPDDAPLGWLVRVGGESAETDRLAGGEVARAVGRADVVFAGSAAQLYLGLWNRGAEVRATGRTELLTRWHEVQHVRWS